MQDPVKHIHKRKSWNRAFSSTAIKEYEHIVANRVRQLVGSLENLVHGSAPEGALLDIAAWLNYFYVRVDYHHCAKLDSDL